MDGVQALVFDVFGTVVDWRSGIVAAAGPFLDRWGGRAEDAAAFADAWRAGYEPAMAAVRDGKRPFVPLDVLHRENLEAVLPRFGVVSASVPEAARTALNEAWHLLPPWPDACEGLERLRARFIVAPHSNGNVRLMIDLARHADLRWDAILGAEVVGAYKPAPESYERTARLLGLSPEAIGLVAAHNGDLRAARRCGFRTCFVPRPRQHGEAQSTDLAPEEDWDLVAPDLVALAIALGE